MRMEIVTGSVVTVVKVRISVEKQIYYAKKKIAQIDSATHT